jgi:site-specific recombinase XerD
MNPSITIQSALESFLGNVKVSQSKHTYKNYRADLLGSTGFLPAMCDHIQPGAPIDELREELAVQYFQLLIGRGVSTATFQRRASAMREFMRFVNARKWSDVSADRFKNLMKADKLSLRPDPPFPFQEIEPWIVRVFDYALSLRPEGNEIQRLIGLRNKAFVITLADTGLRVHEACNLKRGDIEWSALRAVIIGKGGQQGVVRFSPRSLQAIQDYLGARAASDGASGRPLSSLPVFARHDDGGRKRVKPITPTTGEAIVHEMARAALGSDYDERLTCHKFRHYFVTTVLKKTDNLKIGQIMARHKSITNTGRYAHVNEGELDRKHLEIFS